MSIAIFAFLYANKRVEIGSHRRALCAQAKQQQKSEQCRYGEISEIHTLHTKRLYGTRKNLLKGGERRQIASQGKKVVIEREIIELIFAAAKTTAQLRICSQVWY